MTTLIGLRQILENGPTLDQPKQNISTTYDSFVRRIMSRKRRRASMKDHKTRLSGLEKAMRDSLYSPYARGF